MIAFVEEVAIVNNSNKKTDDEARSSFIMFLILFYLICLTFKVFLFLHLFFFFIIIIVTDEIQHLFPSLLMMKWIKKRIIWFSYFSKMKLQKIKSKNKRRHINWIKKKEEVRNPMMTWFLCFSTLSCVTRRGEKGRERERQKNRNYIMI